MGFIDSIFGRFTQKQNEIIEKKSPVKKQAADLSLVQTPIFYREELPNMSVAGELSSYDGWVYACISKNARTAAKTKLLLFEKRSSGIKEIEQHEIIDLIEKPSSFMNYFDLIELTTIFTQLTGEAYWWKVRNESGRVVELYPWLSPADMRIIQGTDRFIDGFIYTVPNTGKEVYFESDDIVYFRLPNPINRYRGKSSLKASELDVATEKEAKEYNWRFFKNGALIKGVLKTEQELSQDSYDRLKVQMSNNYSGKYNAGKMMIIDQGLDYMPTGLTQRDMDFLEQRKFSRDAILAMFGVPKSVLGIVEDVNRANAETSKRVYLEETIDPLMRKIVGTINQQLVSVDFQDNLFLSFEDLTPEDQNQKISYYQSGLNDGWMAPNEVRVLEGLAPLQGGDDIYIAMNKVPMASSGIMDKPKEEQNAKSIKSPKITLEKRYKTIQEKIDDEVKPIIKKDMTSKKKSFDENRKLAIWKYLDRYVERRVPSYRNVLVTLFNNQRRKIIKKINGKKSFGDFIKLDVQEEQEEFNKLLYKPSVVIALDQSDVIKQLFGLVVELDEPDVSKFIEQNIKKFAKETTEETNKQIAKTLDEGIESGDSIPELSRRIQSVFDTATGTRAELIARTEVTRSSTWANEEIYRQAGIKQKEWFVNPGACQFCQPINRKIVSIGKPFFEKYSIAQGDQGGNMPLQYETVLRPPLHPNCRCDLLPVII